MIRLCVRVNKFRHLIKCRLLWILSIKNVCVFFSSFVFFFNFLLLYIFCSKIAIAVGLLVFFFLLLCKRYLRIYTNSFMELKLQIDVWYKKDNVENENQCFSDKSLYSHSFTWRFFFGQLLMQSCATKCVFFIHSFSTMELISK